MRRSSMLAALLLALAPLARADDGGSGDFHKVFLEVEELRTLVEKSTLAPDEKQMLTAAVDRARDGLGKAQQREKDLQAKLAAAELELELYKKSNALFEKRIAELQSRQTAEATSDLKPNPNKITTPIEETPETNTEAEIHGRVTGIADAGLLVISLGTEDGVKVGQSLEVFRGAEAVKPLGTLSLIRAYRKQSIGQFRQTGDDRPEIGDEVSGRIAPK